MDPTPPGYFPVPDRYLLYCHGILIDSLVVYPLVATMMKMDFHACAHHLPQVLQDFLRENGFESVMVYAVKSSAVLEHVSHLSNVDGRLQSFSIASVLHGWTDSGLKIWRRPKME